MGGTEIFLGAATVFFFVARGGSGGSTGFFGAEAFFGVDAALASLAGLDLNRADSLSFTLLSVRRAGILAFLGFSGFITVGLGMTRVERPDFRGKQRGGNGNVINRPKGCWYPSPYNFVSAIPVG